MKNDENSKKILYKKKENIYEEKKNIENSKIKKYESPNNKKNKLKIIITIIVALCVFFLIIIRIAIFFTKFQHTKIDRDDLGINKEIFKGELKEIINVALLGVDRNGVSDAIIIVSLNPTEKKPTIKLISIARDTLVQVYTKNKSPYFTKINEAYGAGEEETTLRTLNKNFNLNIDNFVSIEMEGFAKIIDKLGGVELEITKGEKDQINGIIATTKTLKKLTNAPITTHGKVHLNGAQSVAFARIRKEPTKKGINDDFGRGDRQRELISQIFNKIKQTPKSKIISMIEPCLKHLKTSFTLREIFKIAKDMLGRDYFVVQVGIPCSKMNVNSSYNIYKNGEKKSTVLYDVKYAGNLINHFIYKNITPENFVENHEQKSLNSLHVPNQQLKTVLKNNSQTLKQNKNKFNVSKDEKNKFSNSKKENSNDKKNSKKENSNLEEKKSKNSHKKDSDENKEKSKISHKKNNNDTKEKSKNSKYSDKKNEQNKKQKNISKSKQKSNSEKKIKNKIKKLN